METSNEKIQSFVRALTQLEQHSTMKRPDVRHILSFSVSQAGFRSRQNMYCMRIIHKIASVCGNSRVQIHCVLSRSINCSDRAAAQRSIPPFCREFLSCC